MTHHKQFQQAPMSQQGRAGQRSHPGVLGDSLGRERHTAHGYEG